MKPPWWFCCGWWSPWCVIDTVAHKAFRFSENGLPGPLGWICDRHDAAMIATLVGEEDAA